ncbi:formimidoylglutamate deiminase [Shimwellia pseudoproteus]|uniref:formimidoylglutamate deiminase n=1 Tax=Shimwellia pseudoproteus TaxID=570012 RepID=UPI0018EB234E|nr:formimidoylglutamate deiminase [Shimwellia pseudoproteus]MBJ3814950.1 formimidoylglutamate deiminase [Shimwellia pseudoproteus]
MAVWFAEKALLPDGWAHNVSITISDSGDITGIVANAAPDGERLPGIVVPGMPNLHSHAFQRAMAGLTEVVANPSDSFWSWRDLMYRMAAKITPDQVEIIARYLYIEMLKAGYTSVAEFHYLHHDNHGNPYSLQDSLALRISRAASQSGIGLTLLPVLYSYAGFSGQPPGQGQRRFIQDTDSYLALHHYLTAQLAREPMQRTGLCFHSLRAVTPEQIQQVLAYHAHQPQPVHIHIAEQQKEVDDCLAWCGQRPVAWLFDHVAVDHHWCLIHATHLSVPETDRLAASGAVAGLCPTTEANLGDGIFPGQRYLSQGGLWGIGSDSHITVSVAEELRWLEYGQRLQDQRRNRLALPDEPAIGNVLYQGALRGGAQALGQKIGRLQPGYRADLLVLDDREPFIATASDAMRLNRWLFACSANPVRHVMTGGRWVIKDGHHADDESLSVAFIRVLKQLR